jgi:hypothetical protein
MMGASTFDKGRAKERKEERKKDFSTFFSL